MFRNDDATAISSAPTDIALTGSAPGFFTNGNPAAGQAATIVPDWWLNQLQEELLAILAAGGINPAKGTNDQVLAALRGLFVAPANLPPAGMVNLAGFGTTASFTVPANIRFLDVTVIGAGGGGGGHHHCEYRRRRRRRRRLFEKHHPGDARTGLQLHRRGRRLSRLRGREWPDRPVQFVRR